MPHTFFRRTIAAIGLTLVVAGCGGVKGTYTDPSGAFVLTFNSGGDANFAIPNSETTCSYTVKGDQLSLTCKGDASGPLMLTMHDDGSLSGPPNGFMPVLRKK
jgi:hypothetical protein